MRCARLLWLSFVWTACEAPTLLPTGAESVELGLFDGTSLEGWKGDARYWRVENGALVGESTDSNPCNETSYLLWQGPALADFELELEWRFPGAVPGANSGVQFRSQARSATDVTGYQADLESGPDWTGGLYEQGGRGVVTRRGERTVIDATGAKTTQPFADGARRLAQVVPDGWNRLCVTAFGPRLTIDVNGVLFSETIDLDPVHSARSGTLALQLHAGPPMRVEYRDLRVRSLGDAPLASERPGPAGRPEWVWADVEVQDEQVSWFRQRFELEREPSRAELWVSADNHFEAWLDGESVATSDTWEHPLRVDVRERLRAGSNELLVRARNGGGPAGLVLELALEFDDGRTRTLASGGAFEACVEPEAGLALAEREAWLEEEAPWSPARTLGELGVPPWGTLGEELADSGTAPEAESISVPPGFVVERLYSVPLVSQGSWVSLARDPKGRFYASDQYGGLFRVTASPRGSSEAARVETVPIPLGESHGLLWAFDSLYAVVSDGGEYESGLYRARDTDGDDVLDFVELLRAFDGNGEHGPHGVVLHPDGRSLVIVGGNHTQRPEPFTRSRVPTHWAEDALLAPFSDPNGHAVGIEAPGGWVVRTDPDGAEWELVAVGFRNAYDLAFDAAGELFTWDSDMEWDVGLPWYRPTRILHVVSGADYGWRTGSAKWPADSAESLPAAANVGLASPTGIVFGTETDFPAPWKRALFACDWAWGKIYAIFLEPEGSSYRGRAEVFASGEPFPVTDAVVGLDGALYVTMGGRRTQSGFYRISWAGAQATDEVAAIPGAEQRARRRALEESHGAPLDGEAADGASIGKALIALAAPDPFLRHAARIALESQDPSHWAQRMDQLSDPRARLQAWIARVRSDPKTSAREATEEALTVFEGSSDPAERLEALRLMELVLLRLSVRDGERVHLWIVLDAAYPSGDLRLDRALLGLLTTLGVDVAERALVQLESATNQEERIAILYALRTLDAHWDTPKGQALARRLLEAFESEGNVAEGGNSVHGFLERMRDEARERTGLVLAAVPVLSRSANTSAQPAGSSAPSRASHAWTLAELERRLGEVRAGRDLERGRDAYQAASCNQCHRLAGEGQNFGPDLTGAAGRYSERDLLLATLEPSREVPDVWRDTEFWSEDRLLAVGRLEAKNDDQWVVLETAGTRAHLDGAAITAQVVHPLSRMPEGLLDALTEEEILDLLAYVLAGAR